MISNSTLAGRGGSIPPSPQQDFGNFLGGIGVGGGQSNMPNFLGDRKSLRIAKNVIFYYHNFCNKKKITW